MGHRRRLGLGGDRVDAGHPSLRAVAVERDPTAPRASARNAAPAGCPGCGVVEGAAPAALAGLPNARRGLRRRRRQRRGVLDAAMAALPPGGRLVANAVTLEMEALLLARHAALGGELIRIAVARAAPVGAMHGWRPAMPVTQWAG